MVNEKYFLLSFLMKERFTFMEYVKSIAAEKRSEV